MSDQVTGIAKFCDSICPICRSARNRAPWLKPVIKAEYYSVSKLMDILRIPWPCRAREKQTGKKPWE
jgi:hypothetical protein